TRTKLVNHRSMREITPRLASLEWPPRARAEGGSVSVSSTPFAKLSVAEVNDLLAAAALHIHDGVAITDAASRILWVNAAYCTMTGHRRESLVGRTPALLRPSEVGAERAREIWDSLGACGRFQGRLLNQRADGSVFHAEITVVHVPSQA